MRGTWEGVGPPVVLLHGQPGSGGDWDLVRKGLHGMRVLAPDRPGYDGGPALDFAGNARRLSELLRDTGVTRAVVVGHSWGGGVALQMALDHPEQVAGLCLVGSIGSPLSFTTSDRLLVQLKLARGAALAMCVTAVLSPRAFAFATGSTLSAGQLKQLRRRGSRWQRNGAVSAIAAEQRSMVLQGDRLARRLSEVTAPALVMYGDRDRTVSPAAACDLARALSRGVLLSVPGGHLLPDEAPHRVADAVRQVVAEADW
jgi:pimeloyl-ACP methyl ester carboxylesterase